MLKTHYSVSCLGNPKLPGAAAADMVSAKSANPIDLTAGFERFLRKPDQLVSLCRRADEAARPCASGNASILDG